MKIKFYLTGSGRSPIEDFLIVCSVDLRRNSLHAIRKKTQELPRKEIEVVLKRMKEVW